MTRDKLERKTENNSLEEMNVQKNKQKHYYDRNSKDLEPIKIGQTVRIEPVVIGEKIWQKGRCIEQLGPRQYKVKLTSGGEIIRNRRQLITTNEKGIQGQSEKTTSPNDTCLPTQRESSGSADSSSSDHKRTTRLNAGKMERVNYRE